MTGWLPRFPIVGAASICAKVVRDQELTNWEVKEKGIQCSKEFGCGYPAGAESLAGNQGTLSLVVIRSSNSGVVKKPLASRFWLSLVGALFMVHSCYTHREERRSCRMVMCLSFFPKTNAQTQSLVGLQVGSGERGTTQHQEEAQLVLSQTKTRTNRRSC